MAKAKPKVIKVPHVRNLTAHRTGNVAILRLNGYEIGRLRWKVSQDAELANGWEIDMAFLYPNFFNHTFMEGAPTDEVLAEVAAFAHNHHMQRVKAAKDDADHIVGQLAKVGVFNVKRPVVRKPK